MVVYWSGSAGVLLITAVLRALRVLRAFVGKGRRSSNASGALCASVVT